MAAGELRGRLFPTAERFTAQTQVLAKIRIGFIKRVLLTLFFDDGTYGRSQSHPFARPYLYLPARGHRCCTFETVRLVMETDLSTSPAPVQTEVWEHEPVFVQERAIV